MTGKRVLFAIVLVFAAMGLVGSAGAVDNDLLQRQEAAQQRARQIARELVTTTLDVQLRQLEDNRFTNRPLYQEIREMRKNVDGLIDSEMSDVVTLLVQAKYAHGSQQEQQLNKVRDMVRDIVVKLANERHRLRRRMRTARLAIEVQQVLALERRTNEATLTLPTLQGQDERETRTLKAIQDQHDVRTLYLQLTSSLKEAAGWGPPSGPAAVRGLQVLEVHRVDEHLRAAADELEHVQFAKAIDNQQAVIDGLLALLLRVDAAQRTAPADRATLLRMIAALKQRQLQLKDQSAHAELNAESAPGLVRQQQSIHMELGRLAEELSSLPSAEVPLRQAKAAAVQAVTEIRVAHQQPAVAQQQVVVDQLGVLEKIVRDTSLTGVSGKTARELIDSVEQLQRLRDTLALLRQKQDRVEQLVPQNLAAAAGIEKEVATALAAERPQAETLPTAVAAWLDQAANAAAGAAVAAETRPIRAPIEVARASEALNRIQAEVAAALADAQRTALAVRVGELNRAIEVLERAAANERTQTRLARAAAEHDGLTFAAAKAMLAEQEKIDQLRGKIGEAVAGLADDAADKLGAAHGTVARAISDLRQAAAAKPATDEARRLSGQVAESADQAGRDLADAARLLREHLHNTARELEKVATDQLRTVSAVQQRVDEELGQTKSDLAAKAARLDEAQAQVEVAEVEQLRARGRDEAAEARQLAQRLATALGNQAAADAEAKRVVAGVANSALEAAERQQAAADAVKRLLEAAVARAEANAARQQQREDPLVRALRKAEEAAHAAATQTIDAGPGAAAPLRQLARDALDEARRLAEAELRAAEARPAKAPSPQAQAKVTEAAQKGSELAAPAAPPAAAALKEAVDQSQKAAKQARAADRPATEKSQQATADALAKAAKQLDEARKLLAEQAQKQQAQQAAQAGKLAEEASQVVPAAGAALREAHQAVGQAKNPAAPKTASLEQAKADDEALTQAIETAQNELAARKQQIQHDQQLAAELAHETKQEQEARDLLAKLGEQLAHQNQTSIDPMSPAGAPNPPGPQGGSPRTPQAPGKETPKTISPQKPSPPSPGTQSQPPQKPDEKKPEAQDAAKQLANAVQDFSDAQNKLGQAAEDLAKQKEIKNKPLREALQLAAKLGEDLPKAEPQEFIPSDQPIFPLNDKPPLPEQKSSGGAVPKQGKQDPGAASEPKAIPPQTQGPQNPASTQEQPSITPNPQVQQPADMGPMASQTIQTAPITSAAQQATPPSAADVFKPNVGAPKSATPTSQSTPPMGKKPDPKPPGEKPMSDKPKEKEKDQEKKPQPRRAPQQPQPPAPPLGTGFKPESPQETAKEIAGKDAVEKALEELKKDDELADAKNKQDEMKDDAKMDTPQQDQELLPALPPMKPMEPKPMMGMTGTTPGDLGMGQGTPGKGVGGDSSSPPTEQRPQMGDQHGKFDGRQIDGAAPPITPEGKPGGAPPPPPKPNAKPPTDQKPPPDEIPGKAPEASPYIQPEIGATVGAGNASDVNPDGKFSPGDPLFAEPMAPPEGLGANAVLSHEDAKVQPKDYGKQPWFAKLPPEVQKSIRSNGRRRLPRGYEEQLERYFKNIE